MAVIQFTRGSIMTLLNLITTRKLFQLRKKLNCTLLEKYNLNKLGKYTSIMSKLLKLQDEMFIAYL